MASPRTLVRPCGARIGFEVFGQGPTTILALAPGGMRSSRSNWSSQPLDPTSGRLGRWLPHEQYTVIAMDQRTADERCTVPDGHGWGWDTFRDDQLALLDHCGVERAHLLGSCIGPSFAMKLLIDQPARFGAAVMMQPIGLAPRTTEAVRTGNACSKYGTKWDEGESGLNSSATGHWFGDWANAVQQEGRGSAIALDALQRSLFEDTEGRDFIFSATSAQVEEVAHPLLVLMGNDVFHPSETARRISRIAPNAELIESWRDTDEAALETAARRIGSFLAANPRWF
mmetsp:Transcript_78045/g.224158  ORF Transcript_78045/g.224158 Transcript_78045/m.224158 type:complete len:285 (+) Transcript_78045:86-940(+)